MFMKAMIQSIKGTRDFYPEEMAVRTWLYETTRKVAESYGYQEYDTPFLESIELYAAKSGEELVKEQSFVFPDRSGDLITLRPELTPSLARMIAQRQRQLIYPLRWWSWGPFWRYERPQKGRTREFYQWNIDLIGVDSPEADAEMVAVGAGFLRATGITPAQVNILVNNRQLMDEELKALGVPTEKKREVFRLIDRLGKMEVAEWEAYAIEVGLSPYQLTGLKAVLGNNQLWRKSDSLVSLFQALDALGVKEYVRYAPYIIRGLDYYTGTVFEAWDCDGEFRSIFGGGRYDNLVADVGGEPLPAIGFAMGDLVASLVLKKFGCIPSGLAASPAPILVTIFDEESRLASLSLSAELRLAGFKVICYPEPAKMAKQIKFADRMGMIIAIILGPDERARGQVALKDLRTAKQKTVPQAEIVTTLREMVDNCPAS